MEQLFLSVLNMSLSAAWIVLAVVLLRLVLRKAPKWIHCLLWSAVALRLLIPSFPESSISLVPSAQVIPADIASAEVPVIHTGISAVNGAVNPALSQTAGSRIADGLSILGMIWLAGMVCMGLYSAVSWLRLRRQVRASLHTGGGVYLCDDVDTPFILGMLFPRIYLPSGMTAQQQEFVVAHEKAHLQRKDHWWKPVGYLLLTVHWFNPFLWLGYILLCRDIEKACDEKVIQAMDDREKKGYAEALLTCSLRRRWVLACPLAFGEVAVKTRISAVLCYKKPVFWAVVLAGLICIACSAAFLTDPMPCAHTYEGMRTQAATCTAEGMETFTCVDCWDRYTQAIPMVPHSYGPSWMTKEPTCVQAGEMSARCAGCQQTHVVQVLEPVSTHRMSYSVVREATCAAEGLGRNTCADCGKFEDTAIVPLEHTYREGIVIAGNCTEKGSRQMVCTGCGKEQWYSTTTNDEHLYMDTVNNMRLCLRCGASVKKDDGTAGKSSSQQNLLSGTQKEDDDSQPPVIQWAPEYGTAVPNFGWLHP